MTDPCAPVRLMSRGAWARFLRLHPAWHAPIRFPCGPRVAAGIGAVGAAAVAGGAAVVGGAKLPIGPVPAATPAPWPGIAPWAFGPWIGSAPFGCCSGSPHHHHHHHEMAAVYHKPPQNVPEPSSVAVFAVAAVAVMLIRRAA